MNTHLISLIKVSASSCKLNVVFIAVNENQKHVLEQRTCETVKVFPQIWRPDLVYQDVGLVEEEDDGGVVEPGRMDGGVEEGQTLLHAVLRNTQSV